MRGKRKKNYKRYAQGMSLIELMVTMGLMTGLVLIDLERQRNAMIANRTQLVAESLGNLEDNLRWWLREGGTIANSFGRNAADGASRIVADGVTVFARETAPDNPLDRADITSIRTGDPPLLRIAQVQVNGVRLMGVPDGGTIRSLDGSGWAYIRTMWVQDFKPYHGRATYTAGGVQVPLILGSANLKVLIWKYSNIFQNRGLDCVANNNCEREVITIPIELQVRDDDPGNPGDEVVYDGDFGLKCRPLPDPVVMVESVEPCGGHEFFRAQSWTSGTRRGRTAVVGYAGAACCRFIQ